MMAVLRSEEGAKVQSASKEVPSACDIDRDWTAGCGGNGVGFVVVAWGPIKLAAVAGLLPCKLTITTHEPLSAPFPPRLCILLHPLLICYEHDHGPLGHVRLSFPLLSCSV